MEIEVQHDEDEGKTKVVTTRWEGPGCGWLLLVFVAGKAIVEIIEAFKAHH